MKTKKAKTIPFISPEAYGLIADVMKQIDDRNERDRMTAFRMEHEERGLKFFSAQNIKFFGSRISKTLSVGGLFWTSDKMCDYSPRYYTLRKASLDDDTCSVRTMGEFQAYDSLKEVKKVIKDLETIRLDRENEDLV